jgi:hypothetical protein
MAIAVRNDINPTTMADNWAARISQSGQRWLNGIKAPRVLPNSNPSAAGSNWTAGVTAAEPSYVAGMSAPDYLTNLEAGATAKQASYTGSGAAKKARALNAFTKVAPMIKAALATLPPKGPPGTNTARSTAFQAAMHAQRGSGRATR